MYWIFLLVSLIKADFGEEMINENRCDFIRPAPFSDYKMSNNTFDECIFKCDYDDNCNFIQHFNNSCMVAVKLELTDNFKDSKEYIEKDIITMRKLGTPPMKYYSQLCNMYYSRRSCNANKQCGWKRGLIPYNRESATLGSGWCSRIKCIK